MAKFDASSRARINGRLFGDPGVPSDSLMATAYNGLRSKFEVTAYPLLGAAREMHGVVTVFWEVTAEERDA